MTDVTLCITTPLHCHPPLFWVHSKSLNEYDQSCPTVQSNTVEQQLFTCVLCLDRNSDIKSTGVRPSLTNKDCRAMGLGPMMKMDAHRSTRQCLRIQLLNLCRHFVLCLGHNLGLLDISPLESGFRFQILRFLKAELSCEIIGCPPALCYGILFSTVFDVFQLIVFQMLSFSYQ